MSTSTGIDVSVVIVNWNTAALLDEALASIRDHIPPSIRTEVIVVDNASTDGSREMLAAAWPDVRLITNETNVGYTGASQQAFRVCRGEFVLRLDSDARVTPGCVDVMVARMRSDHRAGVVGPRLVYGDGRWQRWTAGRAPSLQSAAAWLLFIDRLAPHAGVYLGRDVRRPFRPAWVCGACQLVRREALCDYGEPDGRITAYMDDVELCARLRAAGWGIWYEPGATAVHLMSQSTRRVTGGAPPAALRELNRYVTEGRGPLYRASLRALEIAGFGVRLVAHRVLARFRPGSSGAVVDHLNHLRISLERSHA